MKKTILAASIGAAMSFGVQAELIISEYIENGNEKALEIANVGANPISLDGFSIAKDINGNNDYSDITPLSGTLGSQKTIVIAYSQASDELKSKAQLVSSRIGFNGDDQIALKNSNGKIIDHIGEPGKVKFAEDTDMRREVHTPSAIWNKDQWSHHAKTDYNHLGVIGDDNGTTPPPEAIAATIMELQGDSWASPYTDPANGKFISDETFIVEGVVTAIQSTGLGKDLPVGFFIQDENGDGDPNTSDGIFVTGKIDGLVVGDKVAVTGKVKEDYGWTKIQPNLVEKIGTGTIAPITVVALDTDEDFDFTLERHEGMLVAFQKESDMRVTRTYGFDYGPKRNNMVVSNGQVNLHPNQNNAPVIHDGVIDTAPERQVDCNQDKRIVVESFEKVSKGTHVPWYPDFGSDNGTGTTDDYIRIGDVLDGFEGVIGYSYSDFRFYVTNTVTKDNFARETSDRTDAPVLKEGGDLRVATFNVLNYFTSVYGNGAPNPTGQNRGALSPEELELQGDKIANAIVAINADIVGLMEVENNGFGDDSAVAHLVAKINNLIDDPKDYYAYVVGNEGDQFVGSDAIANQVIFRANKVTLDTYRLIEMPQQHAPATGKEDGKNYQRDAITPTFLINGTKEKITVSVNHLKSKGSTCWEDAAPVEEGGQAGKDSDKQGSCENFRVSAAYHLGETLQGIDGYKLILGDLNSYGNEDPIMVLTNRDNAPEDHVIKAARDTFIGGDASSGNPLHGAEGAVIDNTYGFINAVKINHPHSYSYSYNDEVGSLDYILISPELKSKFVDATDWNINAGESTLFQYADKNNCLNGECSTRYADPYRASDHDPAIIDLKFNNTVPPVDGKPPVDPEKPETPDTDNPKEPETPDQPIVTLPSEPVNPPADLPEQPEAPVVGEPIKVMLDLTSLETYQPLVDDKAILNIAKITSYQAASSGGDTDYVTLTEKHIEQGWVALQAQVEKAGEYRLTKVIESNTGVTKYSSVPESIIVTDGKDSTLPDGPSFKRNPQSGHGGSIGLFGLMSLLGFGFLRRKLQK